MFTVYILSRFSAGLLSVLESLSADDCVVESVLSLMGLSAVPPVASSVGLLVAASVFKSLGAALAAFSVTIFAA